MTPSIYLISKRATAEQIELIRQALSITPLSAVVITDARDVERYREVCETVSNVHQPIAIVADFEELLTAIDENGSLCRLPIPSNP